MARTSRTSENQDRAALFPTHVHAQRVLKQLHVLVATTDVRARRCDCHFPRVIPVRPATNSAVRLNSQPPSIRRRAPGGSSYNIAHKFVFDAGYLKAGENAIVLSLPFNGTNYESALLPRTVYVQYDALRLEVR